MSGDDAQELRDTTTRHDERIQVLEKIMEKQEPKLDAIISEMSRLSSYNVEVASSIKRAVFGNGKPGLVDNVLSLASSVEAFRSATSERQLMIDRELAAVAAQTAKEVAAVTVQTAKDVAAVAAQAVKDVATVKVAHDKEISRHDNILGWGGAVLILTMISIIGYLFALHFGVTR